MGVGGPVVFSGRLADAVSFYFTEVKADDVLLQHEATTGIPLEEPRPQQRPERIRPTELAVYLRPMFPQSQGDDIYRAEVHWLEDGGALCQSTVELWLPNDERPDESRLEGIRSVRGWTLPLGSVRDDGDDHTGVYYVLAQDRAARVWAQVLDDERLSEEPDWIQSIVLRRVEATSGNQKVRGFIDVLARRGRP